MGLDFWLPDYSKLAKNLKKWQRRHNLPTRRHRQISFDVVVFLLSLFTGLRFMSILLLVLKLWKFLYKRNLTRNWKYTSLNFDQYLGMGRLAIPNLVWMSPMKSYLMLQSVKLTYFTVPKLLRENNRGRGRDF